MTSKIVSSFVCFAFLSFCFSVPSMAQEIDPAKRVSSGEAGTLKAKLPLGHGYWGTYCEKVGIFKSMLEQQLSEPSLRFAELLLAEQACLSREAQRNLPKAAKSDGLSDFQGLNDRECLRLTEPFNSVLSDFASITPSEAINRTQRFFALASSSSSELRDLALFCLSKGYQDEATDLTLASAMLLASSGRDAYSELVGHYLVAADDQPFTSNIAPEWFDRAYAAIRYGRDKPIDHGQKHRLRAIAAAYEFYLGDLQHDFTSSSNGIQHEQDKLKKDEPSVETNIALERLEGKLEELRSKIISNPDIFAELAGKSASAQLTAGSAKNEIVGRLLRPAIGFVGCLDADYQVVGFYNVMQHIWLLIEIDALGRSRQSGLFLGIPTHGPNDGSPWYNRYQELGSILGAMDAALNIQESSFADLFEGRHCDKPWGEIGLDSFSQIPSQAIWANFNEQEKIPVAALEKYANEIGALTSRKSFGGLNLALGFQLKSDEGPSTVLIFSSSSNPAFLVLGMWDSNGKLKKSSFSIVGLR